jgi:hypothetical protein
MTMRQAGGAGKFQNNSKFDYGHKARMASLEIRKIPQQIILRSCAWASLNRGQVS